MKYLSACSGIEAATVAWHPLGWSPVAFAEIEPFPSAVLAHHYPDTPNLGDMTTIDAETLGPIDLLVGGTPCQSFSVAGLRKGMDDDRGNLALEFVRIAMASRPRWIVWENVPGVLSSNGGRDFGSFLGALGEVGYGFAYRVLDAQYFGLAQRRKRVFVVGHLGDWRPAAAVLLERESLCWNPPPSREAGQVAPTIPSRSSAGGGLGTDFDCDGGPIAKALLGASPRIDAETETLVPIGLDEEQNAVVNGFGCLKAHESGGFQGVVAFQQNQLGEVRTGEVIGTLNTNSNASGRNTPMVASPLLANTGKTPSGGGKDSTPRNIVTHPLRGASYRGGEDGTGRGTPLVPPTYAVRRLTPRECERLQGFPDDYTRIPWRKKGPELCPDGPRYKALGNSMAVPVMRWIGERIREVEEILQTRKPVAPDGM